MFLDVDLSKYDIEREMGGVPYAVIQVQYMKPDGRSSDIPVILGTSTQIKLYKVTGTVECSPSMCVLKCVKSPFIACCNR